MARWSKSKKPVRTDTEVRRQVPPQRKIADGGPAVRPPPTIILNPAAGGGSALRLWRRVRGELESWPNQPAIFETEGVGHATRLARLAVEDGSRLIIAAGGDGTAHEVVQGLLEKEGRLDGVSFSHLPLGTGCDLAFGLGLPANPVGILRGLRPGRDLRIDVGVAELSTEGGTAVRYFLNAANIGIGPAVARRVGLSRWMRRLGRPAYLLSVLLELLRARPVALRWRTDEGEGGEDRLLNLSVCNGPAFGGGMRPCPEASLRSGRLEAAAVGPLGVVAALRQMPRLMRGAELDDPLIRRFSCRSLELEGPPLDVETDGEIGGHLPARLSVRAGGLLVRVPVLAGQP